MARCGSMTSRGSRTSSGASPSSSTVAPAPPAVATMTEPEETPGQQLEQAILGEDVVYNAAEVADETGASLEQAQRLWRALGFPDPGRERAVTQSGADAGSPLPAPVEQGAIDLDNAGVLHPALRPH